MKAKIPMFKTTIKSTLMLAVTAGGLFLGAGAASADEWGAISIDLTKAERSPYYGIGGGGSEDEATKNAQKFCGEAGGKECKVVVTYNQCGAYAASKTGGGWGKSTTKKTAEAQAMSGCNADSCKIVVSDCN
ncbi:MAG: hypothetical protein CFE31_19520 [Rhizobiales bacterium PAR1]|nr:MAG: hypothetical protein CFE31_19520 [Rhizobiales bacterium PAR1]